MKQKIQVLFVVGVLLVCILPLVKFNRVGTISEKENRSLASKPYLFVDNRLNKNFFSEYSNYLNDRFGGRNRLITFNKFIQYDVLNGAIYNEKAFKGKSGWWFYISSKDGNNLSDFYKTNLLNDDELKNFYKNIENTLKWCKTQNIPCIFLIGPNKHSVYSEFYPFEREVGQTRADQLVAILDKLGASYIFPRDAIIAKKSELDVPLYYETDTHWNPLGAFVAYEQLLDMLKKIFPNYDFPVIQYDSRIEYCTTSGDILPMLAVEKSKSTQPKLTPKEYTVEELYTYIKNDGSGGVHTKGADVKAPRALVFRDSFFSALEQFVSPLFSETEYIWKQFTESDKKYVMEYKPDIIIFESVERNFPSICSGVK